MRSSSCSFGVASISVTGSHLPHQADHEAQICGRVLLADLSERLPTMPLPDREQVVDVHLPQRVARRPTRTTSPTLQVTAARIAQGNWPRGRRCYLRGVVTRCRNTPPDPSLARDLQRSSELHAGLHGHPVNALIETG